MKQPSHSYAFQVLLLQAADEGRSEVLFGDSAQRARESVPPFLIDGDFPSVYLEHPLIGDPFLDVTVLYKQIEPGSRIPSAAAGQHGKMLDWYAEVRKEHDGIACGFELDTKKDSLPTAAVHFQPRAHTELVRPFCEAVGEPARAELYLRLANRMPPGWPLSYFGMFRGRPGSPLRVCGYLDAAETANCAQNPRRLTDAFDAIGFSAYDDEMVEQVSALMSVSPSSIDFQFDIYPDSVLGSTFAIDIQFGIEQPEAVRKTFETGRGARVMDLLENWNAADDRWRMAIESTFARALPVECDDGTVGRFALTLMPQWLKARWTDGALQPAKLYHFAHAGLV